MNEQRLFYFFASREGVHGDYYLGKFWTTETEIRTAIWKVSVSGNTVQVLNPSDMLARAAGAS